MQTFCGYIALLGRPNAGKSTLLNACLGQKIVGVSKRPQTTRNRILGVDTQETYQFIFLDTPGMHKSGGQPRMNQAMNNAAWSVVGEADIICYLVDAKKGWHPEDTDYLATILRKSKVPTLVLATKIDSAKKTEIEEGVASIREGMQQTLSRSGLSKERAFIQPDPMMISAKRRQSVLAFRKTLTEFLPAGPWLFSEDHLTDKPERFVVSELIREQLFRQLGQELPYGTTVVVDELQTAGKLVTIKATIVTNKSSHKPIIIGAKGQLIKKIGSEARHTLEMHFSKKVFLELYVKVVEKWVDDQALIAEFQQIEEDRK